MTVELSVREVRDALLRASSGDAAGDGEPATLAAGRIFHELFADLVGIEPRRSGLRVIVESGPTLENRNRALVDHTWRRLLAPRLVAHSASLQDSTAAVLVLWRATRNLLSWLVQIVLEMLDERPELSGSWEQLAESLKAEVPLEVELNQPGWTEPVRLVGIADAVLCLPNTSAFCAIELKLGRGNPSVDLGQAALYHLILHRAGRQPADSALALLHFGPELTEHGISASLLGPAQERLLALVARLAGVLPSDPAKAPTVNGQAYQDLTEALLRAYREQGVRLESKGAPVVGPRFLRFEVRLTRGTKLEAVRRPTAELQHRLELPAEPIVVKDAGRIFIDLPRPDPKTVLFSDVLGQLPLVDPLRGSARLPVGVDPSGRLHLVDLASSGRSHVLVAGSTGSGKSEWLRTAIAGLLAQNTPDTLRLVTIDPKLSAFGDLEGSPWLWKPHSFWIPGGQQTAVDLFEELVTEMDHRYQSTRALGADTLTEAVEKTGRPQPRIVVLCDEYFALVSTSRQERTEIEGAVALLGAKARAAGIHLVLATQQPNRTTVSAAIQTNLPCRVALYLQNRIESRMMLDVSGAEHLTGSGDLLYKDFGDPIRLQAAYLPEPERRTRLRGSG